MRVEEFLYYAWVMCKIMGGLLGLVFIVTVMACVVKGAYDDTVRLINYVRDRRQERKIANARKGANDKAFFEIVSEFHDNVR